MFGGVRQWFDPEDQPTVGRTPPRPARRAVPAYALVTATLAALGGLVVIL